MAAHGANGGPKSPCVCVRGTGGGGWPVQFAVFFFPCWFQLRRSGHTHPFAALGVRFDQGTVPGSRAASPGDGLEGDFGIKDARSAGRAVHGQARLRDALVVRKGVVAAVMRRARHERAGSGAERGEGGGQERESGWTWDGASQDYSRKLG